MREAAVGPRAGRRIEMLRDSEANARGPRQWSHVDIRPLSVAGDRCVVRRLQRNDEIGLARGGGVFVWELLPSHVGDASIKRIAWRVRVLLEAAAEILRHPDVEDVVAAIEEEVDAGTVWRVCGGV